MRKAAHRRRHEFFRRLGLFKDWCEEGAAERVPMVVMRVQAQREVCGVRADAGRESQGPVAGDGIEPSKRRLAVRRLDEGLKPWPARLSCLCAQVLPLGLDQLCRIVAGRLEPAGQMHEGRGTMDLCQDGPTVPCLSGPDDLRQIVAASLDEREV